MKKVVVVDDNYADIFLVEKIFNEISAGVECLALKNGADAIEYFSGGGHADLVISDCNMPIKTGQELLMFLKTNDLMRKIPVVLWSFYNNEDNVKVENYANVFIRKPYSLSETRAVLSAINTLFLLARERIMRPL